MAFDLLSFTLFIGLDVGKSEHHATALTRECNKVYDKALPNSEGRLVELLAWLTAEHGRALLVVDQPSTIGALPVAVAQAAQDVEVAYLPGLTMRRVADLHAGSAKTDARDAYIIAETARTMPSALRQIAVSELAVLAGFDDDLLAQTTAARNRLRGLLTQIHPGLERVVGPRLHHAGVLDALTRWPTPQALTAAGPGHVRNRIKKHNPRLAQSLTEEIFDALDAQTVVVAGTGAAATIVPTTRRSGTSIRGEYANRGGNKRLKSTLFNSAFASLHHPPSRVYYDKKRSAGKPHK